MPNWCGNLLEIAGSREHKKDFILAALPTPTDDYKTDLSLKKLVPYEGEWDYDWCVTNWGTKWDVDATLCNPDWEERNDNLVYKFDSAWAPPEAALLTIAENFSTLGFILLYAEPGMNFSGSLDLNIDYDTMDFEATSFGNPASLLYNYIMSYFPY